MLRQIAHTLVRFTPAAMFSATGGPEKDPTVLQKKLAEHGALLKKLQTELQGQSQMM